MKNKFQLIGEITDFDYHGNWGDYVSPRSLKAWLATLSKGEEAEIEINSPGGSVIQGIEMANAIKNSGAKIKAHVTGIAASMASVVACACDEIEMEEASFMMIHNPWSYAEGDADELRKQADVLDQMKAIIMAFYRGKFDRTEEEISALMTDETWYTGNECVENGLKCTVIKSDVRAAASIVGHKFSKMPEAAAVFLTSKELTDDGRAEIEAARAAACSTGNKDGDICEHSEAVPSSTASEDAATIHDERKAETEPEGSAESGAETVEASGRTEMPPASTEVAEEVKSEVSASPVNDTKSAADWEARYKGASKKINELQARIAELEKSAGADLDAVKAENEKLKAAAESAAGKIATIYDQVKAEGFEDLEALCSAVSGLKSELEKREHDLADMGQQLAHLKSTRNLLTGGVLTPAPMGYADRMKAAKSPEEREKIRAEKKARKN